MTICWEYSSLMYAYTLFGNTPRILSSALTTVFEKFDQQDGDTVKKWLNLDASENYISTWTNYYKDPYYLPRKQWLIDVLQKIRAGDTLSLLRPLPITPVGLIRWYWWREFSYISSNSNWQIRPICWWHWEGVDLRDTASALQLAKEKLWGEWLDLMVFLLTPGAEPEGEITQPEAWITAAFCKSPLKMYEALRPFGLDEFYFKKYSGQLSWETKEEKFERDEYKWGW